MKRSGGFAGLTRQWRAEPPPAEAPVWIDLIDRCPWDAASGARFAASGAGAPPDGEPRSAGADRFVWWIQARCGDDLRRETELADDELVGAWRELVDAVREWSRAAAG